MIAKIIGLIVAILASLFVFALVGLSAWVFGSFVELEMLPSAVEMMKLGVTFGGGFVVYRIFSFFVL